MSVVGMLDEYMSRADRTSEVAQETLSSLAPNTPHPTCNCGRSLNEHMNDAVVAMDAFRALNQGDSAPIESKMNEKIEQGRDPLGYLAYVASLVASDNPFEEIELVFTMLSMVVDLQS